MKETLTDRISDLPEEVISHILSFLTTKQCIATSILSKRWKSMYRPVHTFHLTDYTLSKQNYQFFVQSVNKFISSRDVNQPLQRFQFYYSSSLLDADHVNEWVDAAVQHRLECLMIFVSNCIHFRLSSTNPIFSCKTLSVLELNWVQIRQLSSVYLPSLKTLRLYGVLYLDSKDITELLAGTPNLEVLELNQVSCKAFVIEPKFKRLPKMVRATITKFYHGYFTAPWEVINNVQFLELDWMDNVCDHMHLIPEFPNLTDIEFTYRTTVKYWPSVFEVVKHCPKLRNLSIKKMIGEKDDGKADWPYPQDVPLCISLQLKRCSIINYGGSRCEFRFARYILKNARRLQILKIYSQACDEPEKLKMLQNLTLCSRLSKTCRVSFQ